MAMTHSIAYIKVDGALLRTLPGPKIDLGGFERSAVVGDSTVHGFTRKVKQSMLECEITLTQGFSLKQLQGIENAPPLVQTSGHGTPLSNGRCGSARDHRVVVVHEREELVPIFQEARAVAFRNL